MAIGFWKVYVRKSLLLPSGLPDTYCCSGTIDTRDNKSKGLKYCVLYTFWGGGGQETISTANGFGLLEIMARSRGMGKPIPIQG
ncbi:hypothetical protein ACP4OV_029679 [Aristida adscensionis]